MKIYSWNVNGLRAAHNKGALEKFIKKEDPDVILFQEIKAKEDKLPEELKDDTFLRYYNSAEKAGYSGVAIWIHPRNKKIFKGFKKGMPGWNDEEGRVAVGEFSNGVIVISVYVPNGGKSDEHYQEKLNFFKLLTRYVKRLHKSGKSVIVGGDFNVARSELDLSNPDKYREHTHFNEEIRASAEQIIEKAEMIDSYRERNLKKEGAFSYWDNFSFSLPKGVRPRDVNEGWRLDYLFVTQDINKKIKKATIHQGILGSDHCPISIHL